MMFLDSSMAVHLVPANSREKPCLASFTREAERFLAALYCCVREMYGERAANSAAEEWLRIFEERFDEACDFPELTNITAAAIALFISSIVKPSASLNSAQAGLH